MTPTPTLWRRIRVPLTALVLVCAFVGLVALAINPPKDPPATEEDPMAPYTTTDTGRAEETLQREAARMQELVDTLTSDFEPTRVDVNNDSASSCDVPNDWPQLWAYNRILTLPEPDARSAARQAAEKLASRGWSVQDYVQVRKDELGFQAQKDGAFIEIVGNQTNQLWFVTGTACVSKDGSVDTGALP